MKKGFVKTFESYITEVSKTKWKSLESHYRTGGMGGFADRIAKHSEERGETPTIDVVVKILGYEPREVELTLTDFNVFDSSRNYFQIETRTVGDDSKKVYLEGSVMLGTEVLLYANAGNDQVMIKSESDARDFIKMLMSVSKVEIENPKKAIRSICLAYGQFK
jgi:hypothetical protein